ncbi:hypothetical protein [uncultured Roseobacter sp.]|uniref:hypothetical protein n=1 Tax=uncultured Roseobacter sp. TaxID=114847 RepID=UPI00260ADD5C|nr:hypothetical protein [uncultured Roseobacter sp.]
MKPGIIIAAIAAVAAIAFGVYMIDIDQTEEAALPDVDVSVEGGNLPEFDVETGDIDVGTTTIETTVPTIDIETPAEDNRTAENQ